MQDDNQDDLFSMLNKSAKPDGSEDDAPEAQDLSATAPFGDHYKRRRGAVRVGQRRNKFYTKFVRSMRILLPLTALGLVAILVVTSGDNKDLIKAPPPKEDVVKQTSIGKNELLEPRFDTYDKDGRPYTITAVRAYQTMDDADIIYLEKPVADSTMRDGAWVALESVSGVYNQLAQELALEGNVKLYHDSGYSLLMEKLDIDLKQNIAVSNVAVSGQGPIGQLQASGMTANGADNILIFNGPAKLTLYNMDNMLE